MGHVDFHPDPVQVKRLAKGQERLIRAYFSGRCGDMDVAVVSCGYSQGPGARPFRPLRHAGARPACAADWPAFA